MPRFKQIAEFHETNLHSVAGSSLLTSSMQAEPDPGMPNSRNMSNRFTEEEPIGLDLAKMGVEGRAIEAD